MSTSKDIDALARDVRTEEHKIKVEERKIKTPGRLPNVPAIKVTLPPARAEIRAKVRVHLVCVTIGAFIAILLTWVDPAAGLGHITPLVPTFPSALMEVLDRIRDR